MKTLLTGGAGYIGTHTAIELIQSGHDVVIFDNFSNSHPEAVRRVEQITGRSIALIEGDVRDQTALERALKEHQIDSVVHFAGKKAVGESVAQPVDYFDNNVLAKTLPTFPTTCCPMWLRWRWAAVNAFRCLVATTPHLMAPVCATTSTS